MKLSRYWFIPEAIAVLLAWAAWDVGMFYDPPPQQRESGYIVSDVDPGRPPRAGELFHPVWTTTPHIKDCPGDAQVEIFTDRMREVWTNQPPRAVVNPPKGAETLTPPPWLVPRLAMPDNDAVYRVTTFWYCGHIRSWLYGHGIHLHPIVQQGPDLHFALLPAQDATP